MEKVAVIAVVVAVVDPEALETALTAVEMLSLMMLNLV